MGLEATPGAKPFALAFTVNVTVVPEDVAVPEVEEGVSQFGKRIE
jgi:hypothetical protein